MKRTPRLTLLAVLLVAACVSRTTGNEGNLDFWYVDLNLGQISNFNKPIMVGARLDLKVAKAGGGTSAVTLESASTDEPDAVVVDSFSDHEVVLHALAEGNVLVEVRAEVTGEGTVTDSVNMLAREPQKLVLTHPCTLDDHAAYVVDSDVSVLFDPQRDNGQKLIGYGHWPVDLEPEGVVSIRTEDKSLEVLPLHTDATGSITIASQIDEAELTLDVITDGDVDGIELRDTVTVPEDHDRLVQVLGLVGATRVCWNDPEFSVTVDTPEVCDVRSWHSDDGKSEGEGVAWAWLVVEGKVPGTCTFSVTFEEASAGAGVTESFDLEVTPHRQN